MNDSVRNKYLGLRVTEKEHAAFMLLVKAKGLKRPSPMLRLILSKVLPDTFEPGEVSIEKRPRKTSPIYVTVDDDEAKHIRQKAREESTTAPSWIRKIIRSVLYRQQNFNPSETNALRESNRELAHLGRNINQIARELHISLNASDQVNAQKLEELYKGITQHREKVSALINANWGRMGAVEE